VTADGYEVHFGVNYLGHALLTKLLLPLLQKTTHFPDVEKGDVRVVNVSSTAGWNLAPRSKDGIDLEKEKTDMADTHSYMRYGSSKLAQVVSTREYARRYPEIMTTVLHPGRVETTLLDGFMEKQKWNYMAVFQRAYDRAIGPMTTEQGALCQLWCATAAAGEMENGGLYVPIGVKISGNKLCNDAALGKRLWDWSEEQFREKGYA
jgi:retinol dehydrogenase 12